ncbi:DNA primase [Lewinella sp. W8]|uniref:DNA primase n=1 Tax=Lewinella sp. W8 TaxID=2528208 RepID=UPI0010688E7C|nr:DNA primase [Lewinella sp. W8]MTB50905.1 DNA primase [Lewinella sp. W8]
MITEESVREVIDTARIEDVVGDFVNLRRRGQNMIGLCPFHNEKTPSFNVNPSRNIYKCFGCGEGGDPVKFLMTLEQLSFPDAIRWLADRYNLKLEEKEVSQEVRQERQEKESLLLVNDFARKWFEDQLYNTEEGKSIGLSYFKSRGFRRDVMEKFGLGYAPLQRDAFFKAAVAAGYKEEQLEKLGLVRNKRDFFFDRVMFTIHNLGGKPIAFAGRILKKDVKAPKYVNSPETEVYHKSDVLYGLHQARRSVRKLDNVYMVEGYTDVISLHQHGIENVVATSGTSLTPGQARLIKRQTENVTLLYDGDKAGIKAALRGVDVLLVEGLNVRVVILPDGEDPDSYMQSVGTTAFGDYLEKQRQDFLFFKADLLLEEAGNDVAARTDAIRSIGATLALVDDPLKRAGYLQQFSGRLQIEESLLVSLVNQSIADRRKQAQKEQEREARRQQRRGREDQRSAEPKGRGNRTPPPPPAAGEEDQWAGLVEPSWGDEDVPPMPPPELEDLSAEEPPQTLPDLPLLGHSHQEQHLVYLLIRDGHKMYDPEKNMSIAAFLTANVADVLGDFDHELYRKVVSLVTDYVRQHKSGPDANWYLHHPEGAIQELAQTATVSPYTYSPNWKEKYGLHLSQKPPEENQRLAAEIFLRVFRMEKIDRKVKENVLKIKELAVAGEESRLKKFLKLQSRLVEMRKQLASELGTVVITK